ncbi:MAG: helix-hairpin-helix domain-containing protein, partial [bacterium]|nr:helix-hairpin-helix domain-containing protein [bacterium]
DENGFLPATGDPKLLWAKSNPRLFPVNLNQADYWQLLRVPGVGPTAAEKIMKLRKQNRIRSFSQLANNRFQIDKLRPFVSF